MAIKRIDRDSLEVDEVEKVGIREWDERRVCSVVGPMPFGSVLRGPVRNRSIVDRIGPLSYIGCSKGNKKVSVCVQLCPRFFPEHRARPCPRCLLPIARIQSRSIAAHRSLGRTRGRFQSIPHGPALSLPPSEFSVLTSPRGSRTPAASSAIINK